MRNTDIEYIKLLISKDKLEEVLNILISMNSENIELIQLKGRLENLNKSEVRGQLSNDDIIRYRNQIRMSLISVMSDGLKFTTSDNSHLLVFPVVVMILFCVFIIFFIQKCELPKYTPSNYQTPHKKITQKDTTKLQSNIGFIETKITAYDNSGRKVEYVIFLVNGFNWQLNEIDKSEKYGIEEDICSHLKETGISERINRDDLKGIICLGNTSYEEDISLPKNKRRKNEEDRADYRSLMLATCVSSPLKTKTPVFTANVGKYTEKAEISGYQREIIIIGVVNKDEDAIDEEALFNGFVDLHELENWEIDITKYSKIIDNKIDINKFLN